MEADFIQVLKTWDSKDTECLIEVHNKYSADKQFINSLVSLCKEYDVLHSVTWLLKHHMDLGGQFNSNQSEQIIALMNTELPWQDRLHLLQLFPALSFGKQTKMKLICFARYCLTDDNKFVRAWAYNAFYLLSRQFSELKEEAEEFLLQAEQDEAPSVKARIRNIRKMQK